MGELEDKTKKGAELVRKLFVGTATASDGMPAVPMSEKFRSYTLAHLFGDVWQGEELALEERSLAACVTLIALNRGDEQRLHFVGAKNLGIPRTKIEGVITQVAHYAGWPNAVTAFRILDEVWPADSNSPDSSH